MCKYFILLLSFLCPSALFAQDGAKITILQPDITDGLKADVYQPFNGYANGINITKTVIAKNGKVEIDLKNVTPGVVKLESPLFKYKVFVQPGDKITINASGDKQYSFSGRNAMGQYYVMKMKPTGKTAEEDFNSMILPARSSTALWDSTLTCMEKYKLIYDKLRADGKITPELHQYFLSYVDAFILMYTYMRFNMHLKASSAEKRLNTSLSNEVILSYLEKLYNTYDPFEPKYHSSLLWSLIAGNKLRLENYKHALATLPDSSKWKTFEDNEHIFALAPDSIQEIEMANHILFLIGYGSTEKSEIADFIQVFHQYYPKSKWNRFIDQQFETVPNVVGKLNNLDKAPYYISYDASHGGVQMVMQKKLSAINGVQDLVKLLSPGKPLLIDCWATWCSPCIAELRHSKELHRFLDSAKVNLLYLSFDAPTNRKILPTVQKYNLNGLHYVASDGITQSLIKLYQSETLKIPKFLLFDSQGNLLNANMKLPSSGNQFYQQISNELKK